MNTYRKYCPNVFVAQCTEKHEKGDTIYHQGLKDGSIKRDHSYSLTYAGKRVKDLKSKYETAVKLWS